MNAFFKDKTRLSFMALCLVVVILGGCGIATSLLDTGFGVSQSDTGEFVDDRGLLDSAAPFAEAFIPGIGALITGLGGLYVSARNKKWADALKSTAHVIDIAGDVPAIKKLRKDLKLAHKTAGVKKEVDKALDAVRNGGIKIG